MSEENWDEEAAAAEGETAAAAAPAIVAELPEIKLFGKWSCEEVNISDMSLQVRCNSTKLRFHDVLS